MLVFAFTYIHPIQTNIFRVFPQATIEYFEKYALLGKNHCCCVVCFSHSPIGLGSKRTIQQYISETMLRLPLMDIETLNPKKHRKNCDCCPLSLFQLTKIVLNSGSLSELQSVSQMSQVCRIELCCL